MNTTVLVERALYCERLIVAASLAILVGLAWLYLWQGAGTGMSVIAMSTWRFPPLVPSIAGPAAWSPDYAILILTMWWVMMIAMMVPSAAPMILLYSRVVARAASRGQSLAMLGSTGIFLVGYLSVWFAFSAAATLGQYLLEVFGALDGMRMWSTNQGMSAAILMAAGVYQLLPIKAACLDHCRAPIDFLSRHFRPGNFGAWRMGLEHGTYCVGCCWALMLLLYVGGAMNMVWIVGLSLLVLVEKLAARGKWLERGIGLLLIAAGVGLFAAG